MVPLVLASALVAFAPAAASEPTAALPSTHLLDAVELNAARLAIHQNSPGTPAPKMLVQSYNTLEGSLAARADDVQQYWRSILALNSSDYPTVMSKSLSLPGVSKHNYISIGIYNHPCNAQPKGCKPYPSGKPLPPSECDNSTGLPWVPCDGIRNTAAIAEGDSPTQGKMANAAVALGLAAYYATNATASHAYIAKAVEILTVWFIAEETKMLPNLYYGQISPKEGAQAKGHGGFIEWAHTAFLLDHFQLLRFAAARDNAGSVWTPAFDQGLAAWWSDFEIYVEGKEAQGERDMTNNHGSWYDVTWLSVALFNQNTTARELIVSEIQERRIAKQILPDGREWIELERNVPSGYCQYNLQALSEAADLARPHGESGGVWDFATSDGRSLRKSIDWLAQYATGAKPWPYPQPEQPDWQSMVSVLRRASIAYSNRSYEAAGCKIMTAEGKQKGYTDDILNLQLPPKYYVDNC